MVDDTWPEDKITRELYVHIHVYVAKNGINTIPIHQYPIYPKLRERGRPPTIDFVFRKGFEESPYLGFECKIVDSKQDSSIKDYIDEGMRRFLSGKYSATERIGGMSAYIVNCEVLDCIHGINKRIENHSELGHEDRLVKSGLIPGFDDLYKSRHERRQIPDFFLIYHIFMYFGT